jgi:ribokinase
MPAGEGVMASRYRYDVVVVGGANTDHVARGEHLPAGSYAIGDEYQVGPGGKGANQAVAAARLGARVAFVGCVGDDLRGEQIVEHLRGEGVDVRHVARDHRRATGVALIHVDASGRRQSMCVLGANLTLGPDDVAAAREAIESTAVLIAQLEIPLATAEAAIHLGHDAGARVVLDPAPPLALPPGLLRHVDLVTPNAEEAEFLTGVEVRGMTTARAAGIRLLRDGAGAAAIQAGEEGNLVIWPDGEYWNPYLDVDVVDLTGAGDAYTAALAVAMAEGHPWEEAAPFANAASSLATTGLGAQAPLPLRQWVSEVLLRS